MNFEKIICDFVINYPRCAEYTTTLNDDYPLPLKMKMIVGASVVMSLLKQGHFNKYLKDKCEISNEVIDMFAINYLKNYVERIDALHNELGSYFILSSLEVLNPKKFIEDLINQNTD